VKNNFPGFLGNHPAELDGYFEIAEVVFDALLKIVPAGLPVRMSFPFAVFGRSPCPL
jgi:hypothetical protein